MQLTDSQRKARDAMGAKPGTMAWAEIASMATPDTLLAWHHTCADRKVDASEPPKSVCLVKDIPPRAREASATRR